MKATDIDKNEYQFSKYFKLVTLKLYHFKTFHGYITIYNLSMLLTHNHDNHDPLPYLMELLGMWYFKIQHHSGAISRDESQQMYRKLTL